jgi:hypothetical protein
VSGCTDSTATNYDPLATIDDGSCVYPPPPPSPIYGCTDPAATNYDQTATDDDGSCTYPSSVVYGCTDASSPNYDPLATYDDGSCIYPCSGLPPIPGYPGYAPGSYWYGKYPNNETAIEHITSLYGPDVNIQMYTFYSHHYQAGHNSNVARYGLRIRHVSLDAYFGYKNWFFSWRQYIDAALNATDINGDHIIPVDSNGDYTVVWSGNSYILKSPTLAGPGNINGYNTSTVDIQQGIFWAFDQHQSSLLPQPDPSINYPTTLANTDKTFSTECTI